MSFKSNILKNIASHEKNISGFTYVPWIAALYHAGSPEIRVRLFDGKPYLPIFGSAMVCVEVKKPNGAWQETWLPALDTEQQIIAESELDSRTINDLISRCKAKAIATTCGVGLSLYDGKSTAQAKAFVQEAGLEKIAPGMSFEEMAQIAIAPRMNKDRVPYVPWVYSVAAARIADDDFRWWVEELAIAVNGTYMVAVGVEYQGRTQIEYYPIMTDLQLQVGTKTYRQSHVAATEPTVMNLNTAIMRALARSVAIVSGYGISVYFSEEIPGENGDNVAPVTTTQAEKTQEVSETEQEQDDPVQAMVERLRAALKTEARIARVLDNSVKYGYVENRPQSLEELVRLSPIAAEKILAAYGKN